MPASVVQRTESYMILRVNDGRLEDWGLHETYEAAKKRMAGSGLDASWKIAVINCYFQAKHTSAKPK